MKTKYGPYLEQSLYGKYKETDGTGGSNIVPQLAQLYRLGLSTKNVTGWSLSVSATSHPTITVTYAIDKNNLHANYP